MAGRNLFAIFEKCDSREYTYSGRTILRYMITDDIRNIINDARATAVRSVDFCRVQMYWRIGQRIVEEEQDGNANTHYGDYIIRNLSKTLKPEFGSGFGVRQLEQARKFYIEYPIANALRSQFNWTQYRALIQIPDKDKRAYYELEAANNNWTAREMERQIHSMLYERLLLSNDKDSVLAVARRQRVPQTPQEIIRDPMVLEFLGLENGRNIMNQTLRMHLSTICRIFCLNSATASHL